MPVIFSRACEYASRALSFMANDSEKKYWSVYKLVKDHHIPVPFLAKTFQILVSKDILHSSKRRSEGFSFALPSDQIKLISIVEAIEDPKYRRRMCFRSAPMR